jgi:hypothetical protein
MPAGEELVRMMGEFSSELQEEENQINSQSAKNKIKIYQRSL